MLSEYLPKFEFKNLYLLILLKQNRKQIHKTHIVQCTVVSLSSKERKIGLFCRILCSMKCHTPAGTHIYVPTYYSDQAIA